MKKILRAISLAAVISLLCILCTGCVSIVMESSVNEDGSGTIRAAVGAHESIFFYAYEQAEAEAPTGMSFEEYMKADAETESYSPYTYNGETYWGNLTEMSFASLEEFNTAMFTDENGAPNGTGSLVRDENGEFVLTLNISRSSVEESSGESLTQENLALVKEINEIVPMPMHFFLSFPKAIGRASGALDCVTLAENELVVDLFAASVKLESGTDEMLSFVFSTAAPTFSDTPVMMWYTAAVEALAEGGLVNGVGEGRFAPDQTLSVSEFAQILARASGMEVGAGESYWAEKALSGCVAAGYIADRGEISKENYEVPIERQEAVAAMQRAGGRAASGTLTAADIPDFESIDPALRADILAAYNSGVTSGTDASRTFVPTGLLTRGQVCQLFYNLDWTAPLS